MSEWTPLAMEWWQQLALFLSLGLPGVPQGTADPQRLQLIPQNAVVAIAWDGRGAGTPGAAGLEGAWADPEIRRAITSLKSMSDAATRERSPQSIDHVQAVVREVMQHPGCLYVNIVPATESSHLRWEVALILQPIESGDAVLARLADHVPSWALKDVNSPGPQPYTTGLVTYQRLGSRLVWSMSDAVPGMARRLESGAGGLSQNPAFQQLRDDLKIDPSGSLVWIQIPEFPQPVSGWAAALKPWLAPITNWSVLATLAVDQGRVVARAGVRCPPEVLAQRTSQPSIPAEAWSRIPADAQVVAVAQCPLADVIAQGLRFVEQQLPGQRDPGGLFRRLEAEFGFDIVRDVEPAFGETWVLFSAPSTDGALGLGPVLSLDVTETQTARQTFRHVVELLQQNLSDEPKADLAIRTEDFIGQTLYSLRINDPQWGKISPSFCLTERELVLTLQPQTLRAYLRWLNGDYPHFGQRDDYEAFSASNAQMQIYVDPAPWTSVLWPMVPYVLGNVKSQSPLSGAEFDISRWPSTASVLEYLRPMTVVVAQTEWGWSAELRNPVSVVPPLLAGTVLWQGITAREPAVSPGSTLPDLGQPAELTIDLGTAEGESSPSSPTAVVPAAAETTAPRPRSAWRSLVPGLIRVVTPDDVELLIPNEAFQAIEDGPTPEQQQRREARKKSRSKAAKNSTDTP